MEKETVTRKYTQQDDIVHTVWWYSDYSARTLLDISSWQFQADLCDSLISKIRDLDVDVSSLVSGFVKVLITNDITVLLTPDRYSYDLAVRDANGYQLATYTFIFEIMQKRTTWE